MIPGEKTDTEEVKRTPDDAVLEQAASTLTRKPLEIRLKDPTKAPVSVPVVELPGTQETTILQTWKKALSLDEERCGANTKCKKTYDRCTIEIAPSRIASIEALIKLLMRLNNSPQQVEKHLHDLAKLVHCHRHDHPPICDSRIGEWLAALPEPLRTPTLERRLRTILDPVEPSKCASLTAKGKPCKNSVKSESQYFYRKTISEMVHTATSTSVKHTLEDLASVLRHHILCHTHKKHTPIYPEKYSSAIDIFQADCERERERLETKSAIAKANKIGEGSTTILVNSRSHGLLTPPSSPEISKMSRDPSTYWKEGFDTSPLHVLGKFDDITEHSTPQNKIVQIIRESLCLKPLYNEGLSSKPSDNEVNDGYLYSFTVPGNAGFVKIGFTTRKGNIRIEKWRNHCNRNCEVIYPATKVVPHAHRIERLVHAELSEYRRRIYCERCLKQHVEWFTVPEAVAIASLKKWSLWMAGRPYEEKNSEWLLKEEQKNRLHDIGVFLKDLHEAAEVAE
jgi:hypothetical protein